MYNTLTAIIDEYIKQNNVNAITGPILNDVLRDMVDALGSGMRFMGVANSTTVPVESDAPKFYLSFTPGTYPNFFSVAPAFMSGLAIFYDIAGTNTWAFYNWPLEQSQPGPESFVVDADVLNNTYSGDTILYVSEATRASSGSSITVKRTDTSGTDYGQVAYISEVGQQSGFKSYTANLTDTAASKLSVSVNWDTLSAGETKTFTVKEAAMPQKAYTGQAPLRPIYDRLQQLEQQQPGPESFVVDADILNNEYSGEMILYVSEASRSQYGSYISVKRTDISGNDYGQVAYISEVGQQSGFKSYTTSLTDTTMSKLNMSVNWDSLQPGETKTFTVKEATIPQKAYTGQALLRSIYDRLQQLEYSAAYVNNKTDGEVPIAPRYDGLNIKKYMANPGETYNPAEFSRSDNAFASSQGRRVYKVGNPTFDLYIKTGEINNREFHAEIVITNERGVGQSTQVSFELDSYDGFVLRAPAAVEIPYGKSMLVTIYGVKGGTYNVPYNDKYNIHVFTNVN